MGIIIADSDHYIGCKCTACAPWLYKKVEVIKCEQCNEKHDKNFHCWSSRLDDKRS